MIRWPGKKKRSTARRTAPSTKAKPPSTLILLAAIGPLSVSLFSTVVLVLGHFEMMSVPGCGIGSPCADAAASVWGKIPLIEWPVSFVGLAYFIAVGVGWLVGRGLVPRAFKWLIRLGAAASLFYVFLIVIFGHWCWYCLAAHAGNFAFWWIVERRAVPTGDAIPTLAPTASAFVACSLVLAVLQIRQQTAINAEAAKQIAETTKQVIAVATAPADKPPTVDRTPSPDLEMHPESDTPPVGFTGRYHRGPDSAAIRVVVFTDYQCPICRRLEETIERLLSRRTDVRLSVKQFPECEDCNPYFKRKNLHPNACRAAFAAEAAGILGGDKAFWKMHAWLFQHGGVFSFEELAQFAREIDLDSAKLLQVMESPRVQARIDADISEAASLGIPHTPMIFINGVELRGTSRRDALLVAANQLAESRLPVLSPDADRPRLAADRYLELWKKATPRSIPPLTNVWPRGPSDAGIHVVMWGDYQDAETVEVDMAVRRLQSARDDIRYEFRPYPLNASCNPTVSRSDNLMACITTRAALAAGLLQGEEGFWRMHEWLMENRDGMYEEGLMAGAAKLGFDRNQLTRGMRNETIDRAIAESARAAADAKLKTLPLLFINGRQVPRFYGRKEEILGRIFDESKKLRD
ncbi:MAG: DsbA family protein [Planctomycetia bacterium]|jgi:protein-disulfide isomerase/uncharacterized membrane protein|nr:DsbA family protein [Planctomycetia bacterium]MCC7314169.1 DsbA family protein [Planctomycetota bacterium]